MQQVPGAADVDHLALEAGGHVGEEVRQVAGHVGLQLVEVFFLGHQFGADHQTVQGAFGMGRAHFGAQVQHIAGERGGIGRVEMVQAWQHGLHDRQVAAHVAEVALAVVGVHRMHVRHG
ncbi:hypothetical protein D3C76_1276440 [compost metagenome]